MGELSTKSIIGLWTEEPDPADPTQVVRPPAGTTVNVWDYETGAPLAPVVTGQRGYIPPTDYPGVRVFAVSTGPDFAAATVAFPSETLMGAIVDAGLTADVSEAWPTYAHPYVGERHRHFDPIKGHYHASPDDAGWRTKLLGTRRGFRSTTISIMGSSSVAGQSSPGLLSWGLLMRDRLAAAGMGVQGTGVTYAGQAFAVSDPRWTFSAGGVAQVSVRLSATIDNTSWAQFASDIAGQNVKIHYQHDGGSFTYSIDGDTAVAVAPNGSAANGVVTVTGLANTTHTVKITGTNATATKLIGVEVYGNTNGLNVTVAGVGGSVTANWTGSTYADNWTMARLRAPALTVVAMGGNDATTSVPLATFRANLEGIIALNTYSSSGTLLVVMPHANTVDLTTYRTYVSAMYDVADSEGVDLVDMSHRWGSLTQATAGNLMVDTVHPNTAGHEDYASAVAAMILG